MNILVFNCGSSSLKYSLLAMPEERELVSGEAQRVGGTTAESPFIIHETKTNRCKVEADMPDHDSAFREIMQLLMLDKSHLPDAMAHRIVHGGSQFTRPVRLDNKTFERLESIQDLAPLHNPPAIKLARACENRNPEIPQIAVFDTAFHSTIPEKARTYALPKWVRKDLGIRKYGFHGISHEYVSKQCAEILDLPYKKFNGVTCHLGTGGASLCAIQDGKSINNTMGYSPLQGLVMSTRCGDTDPALVLTMIADQLGNIDAVENLLNKNSGVLGLSESSSDLRDIFPQETSGDQMLSFPQQVYLWRLRKYIGAYLAQVRKPQAIVFTDTVGVNMPLVRWVACSNLQNMGLEIDKDRNFTAKEFPAEINASNSDIRAFVILTNEELQIARYATQYLN